MHIKCPGEKVKTKDLLGSKEFGIKFLNNICLEIININFN